MPPPGARRGDETAKKKRIVGPIQGQRALTDVDAMAEMFCKSTGRRPTKEELERTRARRRDGKATRH